MATKARLEKLERTVGPTEGPRYIFVVFTSPGSEGDDEIPQWAIQKVEEHARAADLPDLSGVYVIAEDDGAIRALVDDKLYRVTPTGMVRLGDPTRLYRCVWEAL